MEPFIDISLPGLLGAIAGTAVAAGVYPFLLEALEAWLKVRGDGRRADASMLRRLVLVVDLTVFALGGYLIGTAIWG